MKPLSVIVIGCGNRGTAYAKIMAKDPEKFRIVGMADPIEAVQTSFRENYGLEESQCFSTWEDILGKPRFADVAVIATMDRMHTAPAVKAMEAGYDLLLEKPAAPTAQECNKILQTARRTGRKVVVCHVLRYTPFYLGIKRIVDSGMLGQILSVEHIEAVGNVHQSHSFVRGNWGNQQRSSSMLLQKCCHDLDILQWLLNTDCKRIQSFGARTHFRQENAPEGAPERCTDGCPYAESCYYNAVKLYYDDKDNRWFRTTATKLPNPTDEEVLAALQNTQYGKCVYRCDNDVVDHQTVNMEFEGGTTVSMTMCAFTKGRRRTHLMGTKGELTATMDAPPEKAYVFYDFATREETYLDSASLFPDDTINGGHGGGDQGVVAALYDYLTGALSREQVSEIEISCRNHMLVFAAEQSRLTGTVTDVQQFLNENMA